MKVRKLQSHMKVVPQWTETVHIRSYCGASSGSVNLKRLFYTVYKLLFPCGSNSKCDLCKFSLVRMSNYKKQVRRLWPRVQCVEMCVTMDSAIMLCMPLYSSVQGSYKFYSSPPSNMAPRWLLGSMLPRFWGLTKGIS